MSQNFYEPVSFLGHSDRQEARALGHSFSAKWRALKRKLARKNIPRNN